MTTADFTLADIAADPKKYEAIFGIQVPTFDEYVKNPEKYKTGKYAAFECVENGPGLLRKVTGKMYYHIHGYKVETLEKVEQIALDLGWDLSKMDIKPNLESVGGGKYDTHVTFVLKGQVEGT